MKTKHTPGPWFRCFDRAEGQTLCCIVKEDEKLGQVEEVIGWINRYAGNCAEANATLIASAPELLATLRKIGVWLIAPRTDVQTLAEMNTLVCRAIAKAEGRKE